MLNIRSTIDASFVFLKGTFAHEPLHSLQKLASDPRCKGMPLSSFLLKPMQRITRYPLLIRSVSALAGMERRPAEGHGGPSQGARESASLPGHTV